MLEIPPIKKNFKFSNFFSPKKYEINNIIKIVKIYTVGVCIERKANKHTKESNTNHPHYQQFQLVEPIENCPYKDLTEIFDFNQVYKALNS